MLLSLVALALASPPDPVELTATPPAVALDGRRAVRQVLVSGRDADGRVRDFTNDASATVVTQGIVEVGDGLFLRAVANGTTDVTLTVGGKSTAVRVTVTNASDAFPPSFRRDVVGSLNVGGCNMGACHGTPSGKNGFKLSLRGADPAADFLQLTRDQFGRRTDAQSAGESLILQKALGRIPHEGGTRFTPSSVPARMLRDWLAAGMPDDPPALPAVAKVTVLGARVQLAPAARQQLAVVAAFADGATRDVTRLTNFSTSDPGLADVTPTGRVDFKRPGEVAVLCRYLDQMISVRLTYLDPRPGFVWPDVKTNNYVDTHVFTKLKTMTIAPSDVCNDSEFVRRAYLDAVGRLPTVAEAKAFLNDAAADKRPTLITQLLTLPEFADFWALKWADVLRSSRKTVQLKGSLGLQTWLREQFVRNVPFDQTVRELLTAAGDTATNPPANYYRIAKDPQSLGETTAQLFLGVRMQCAKCHNHPFERWTQDDYFGMAAWFARVRQRPTEAKSAEIVYVTRAGDVTQPRTGKPMPPRYPGASDTPAAGDDDRRTVFADWLTKPGNPFFAKSVANRVWFHLLSKGIVDPVDDFRDSNPASNDELLDALAKDFAESGFDLKRLVYTIMTSRTYQLSAKPNATNADDSRYFSHAVTKLLTAEQLLDAVCDVTGVPEKFTGLPAGTRAVQLPDGEVNHPFLKAFGQPAREIPCECEREADGNLGQALQLINGTTVNEKVRNANNRLGSLLTAKKSDEEILADIYWAALARPPKPAEAAAALGHVAKAKDKRKGWEDVLWAVVNMREFLFRH
jgi:hypothetical protein